jgi:hypothetical protein
MTPHDQKLREAVANLIKVKGRFHTEQAYQRLVEAYDALAAAEQQSSAELEWIEKLRHEVMMSKSTKAFTFIRDEVMDLLGMPRFAAHPLAEAPLELDSVCVPMSVLQKLKDLHIRCAHDHPHVNGTRNAIWSALEELDACIKGSKK